jgi:hypothetical protein
MHDVTTPETNNFLCLLFSNSATGPQIICILAVYCNNVPMVGTKDDEAEMEYISAAIPQGTKRNIRVKGAKDGRTMAELVRETLIEEFGEK